MNKKILIITSEYPGKVATFITRDINILCENSYQVDLFPIYPIDDEKWKFVPNEGIELIETKKLNVIHLNKVELIMGIFNFLTSFNLNFYGEMKKILNESKKYGSIQWRKSLYTILWTLALLRKTKNREYSKVISYWGNYSGTAAYLFSKYSFKNCDFYTYLHAGVDLYRDQIYLLEKLKKAKKIITVCEFNKKFLKNLYPNNFREFINKVNIYHLPIKIKEIIDLKKNKNQFIAVGRLDKKKGLDYFIKAVNILKIQDYTLKVKIIGDGPEKENLIKLVDKFDLNDMVEFLGHMPYGDVEKNIAESIALVHSSPELGDAVPTVIKESMSLGTPVIGTKIAGIPELLDFGRVGILIEEKNEKSIANAMIRLLEDEYLQKEFAQKGREFALEKFNIDINSKELIDIINKD